MVGKKKTLIIISAVIIFMLSLAAAFWFIQNKYTVNTYNNALQLIDNDSYKAAKTELLKIVEFDYKDTDDLIKLCEAHISYDNGCTGAYMSIDDLEFKYQTKERLEKIYVFIEESKLEYNKFFDELVEKSKPKSPDNSASSQPSYSSSNSSSTYKSKSYSYKSRSNNDDEDYDEFHANEYKFAEDFYDDYYEEFYDFDDAEDYFNTHND